MATPKAKAEAAGKAVARGDRVYLIDASGYIFRAYHALPPLTRPSDGLPVGAVHGFCGMLWKLLRETGELDPPTHLAAVFDLSEHTFRTDLFADYKANRSEPPDDLIPQFPLVRDAVRAFNVACIEKRGYEADDIIATYAFEALDAGAEVTIVSSDKDLMQTRSPRHPHVRHHEEQGDRRGGSSGALRCAAGKSGRGAGTDRRFHRQRARRSGYRAKDGGPDHQRVRRSGDAVFPRPEIKQNKRRENLIYSATRRACRRRWSFSMPMCPST